MLVSHDNLEEMIATMEEYFHTANTGGLIYEFVNDTIGFGHWLSEWVEYPRDAFFTSLTNYIYNFQVTQISEGNPSQMTFTSDRSQFPELMGISIDGMMGPDVNLAEVIFSTGWGEDGQGEALLFIGQDPCGKYYWIATLYFSIPFDDFDNMTE